jgi:hypothetical protein
VELALWDFELQVQLVKLLQQAERLPLFPKEFRNKRVIFTGIELSTSMNVVHSRFELFQHCLR